jgi:hypothetical protein
MTDAKSVIAKLKAMSSKQKEEKKPAAPAPDEDHATRRAREARERKAQKDKEEADIKAGIFDRKEDAPAPKPSASEKPLDEDLRTRLREDLSVLQYIESIRGQSQDQPEAVIVRAMPLVVFGRKYDVYYSPTIKTFAIQFTLVQDLFAGPSARPYRFGYLISCFAKPMPKAPIDDAVLEKAVQMLSTAKTVSDFKAAVNVAGGPLSAVRPDLKDALVSLERLFCAVDHKHFHASVQKQGKTDGVGFPDVLYGATGKLTKTGQDMTHNAKARKEETKHFLFKLKAMCEAINLAPAVYYATLIKRAKGPQPASARPFGGACDKWPDADSVEMLEAVAQHYDLRMIGYNRKIQQADAKKKKKMKDEEAPAADPVPASVPAPVAAPAASAPVVDAKDGDEDEDKDGDVEMSGKPDAAVSASASASDEKEAGYDEKFISLKREIAARLKCYVIDDEIRNEMLSRICTVEEAEEWIMNDDEEGEGDEGEDEDGEDGGDSDDGDDEHEQKKSSSKRKRDEDNDPVPAPAPAPAAAASSDSKEMTEAAAPERPAKRRRARVISASGEPPSPTGVDISDLAPASASDHVTDASLAATQTPAPSPKVSAAAPAAAAPELIGSEPTLLDEDDGGVSAMAIAE